MARDTHIVFAIDHTKSDDFTSIALVQDGKAIAVRRLQSNEVITIGHNNVVITRNYMDGRRKMHQITCEGIKEL